MNKVSGLKRKIHKSTVTRITNANFLRYINLITRLPKTWTENFNFIQHKIALTQTNKYNYLTHLYIVKKQNGTKDFDELGWKLTCTPPFKSCIKSELREFQLGV